MFSRGNARQHEGEPIDSDTTNVDDPDVAEAGSGIGGESSNGTDDQKRVVRGMFKEMKEFASELTIDDLKSGNWFARLLTHSLNQYREKVDWEYFEVKYPGMPRDAVVEARIKLAARYAAIAGGLSASAYSGAVAATIGSLGGASPITATAAVGSLAVDLFTTTTIQLRLAYDIAVLYRVPIDFDDPEDLWRFIRVSFVINGGDKIGQGVIKGVPVVLRPALKKVFSGSTLAAVKSLPVVGRHLLQRNIIKFGIPAINIPLATGLNYWLTKLAGRHARHEYRTEAKIREQVERLIRDAPVDRAVLWVAWWVIVSDKRIQDLETVFMRQLLAGMFAVHGLVDEELREMVEIDEAELLELVDRARDYGDFLCRVAQAAAEADGPTNKEEREVIERLEKHLIM